MASQLAACSNPPRNVFAPAVVSVSKNKARRKTTVATPRILGERASVRLAAYYRGPDHPMKLRLWRWLRQLSGYPRLRLPYAGGWITLDERDFLQNMILQTGSYEPEVWRTLEAHISGNDILWDVGGHIGSVAIRALLDPRLEHVHVFEPDPGHLRVLAVNLSFNPARYVIHPYALSDHNGVRELFCAAFPNSGTSTLQSVPEPGNYQGRVKVSCRRADDLIFSEGMIPPTLMKVDVEGWELPFFQGARRLLHQRPPKAIVFEARSGRNNDVEDQEVKILLEDCGYHITWIRRPEGVVYPVENYLAVFQH